MAGGPRRPGRVVHAARGRPRARGDHRGERVEARAPCVGCGRRGPGMPRHPGDPAHDALGQHARPPLADLARGRDDPVGPRQRR